MIRLLEVIDSIIVIKLFIICTYATLGNRQHAYTDNARSCKLENCSATFLSHLLHDLGCHPTGRTNKCMPDFLPTQVSTSCKPSTHTKVCYLNSTILSQQNISSFYVPAK